MKTITTIIELLEETARHTPQGDTLMVRMHPDSVKTMREELEESRQAAAIRLSLLPEDSPAQQREKLQRAERRAFIAGISWARKPENADASKTVAADTYARGRR
jgi:hypothetical protein